MRLALFHQDYFSVLKHQKLTTPQLMVPAHVLHRMAVQAVVVNAEVLIVAVGKVAADKANVAHLMNAQVAAVHVVHLMNVLVAVANAARPTNVLGVGANVVLHIVAAEVKFYA